MRDMTINLPSLSAWALTGLVVDIEQSRIDCRITLFSGDEVSGAASCIVTDGACLGFAAAEKPTAARPVAEVQAQVDTGYSDLVTAITKAGGASEAAAAVESFLTSKGLAP